MSRVLRGIVQNGQVRLVEDHRLAEGTSVIVHAEASDKPDIMELFGACKDDPSLKSIFSEIAEQRRKETRSVPIV